MKILCQMCLSFILIIGLGTALVQTGGCVAVGQDPVLVNAQKVAATSFDAINTFLIVEHDNRAIVQRVAPEVDTFAIRLGRHDGPVALKALQDAIAVYQKDKSAANASSVQAAADALASLASSATTYLNKTQATTVPSPSPTPLPSL